MSTAARPARLIDIARAVGVHTSVVSRTLSKDPTLNIRDETRSQIFATAAKLGYRGSSAARSLKGAIIGAIAVVMPSLRNPVWAEIIRGALAVAEREEFALLLAEVPDDSADDESYVRLVEEGRIDGLLIGSSEPAEKRGGWPPVGIPTVHVNRGVAGADCNVVLDEVKAVGIPLDHLAELGHRRVALLDGPLSVDTVQRRRRAGSIAAHHDSIDLSFINADFDEAGGLNGIEQIIPTIGGPEGTTAVIVSSLTQLVGALAGLRAAGVDVPGDLSIICLDDDPLLDYLDVRVASVRMPLYELGEAGAQALITRVRGGSAESLQIGAPMSLVERASTRPVR